MTISVSVLLILSITSTHGFSGWGFMPFHPMMMGMYNPWAASWYGANRWGQTASAYAYPGFANNVYGYGSTNDAALFGKLSSNTDNAHAKDYGYNQNGYTSDWYGNAKYGSTENKYNNGDKKWESFHNNNNKLRYSYSDDKYGYGKWGYGYDTDKWGYGSDKDKWGYGYDINNWGYGYNNNKYGNENWVYGYGNNKYSNMPWGHGYGDNKYSYGNNYWGYGPGNDNWGYGNEKLSDAKWLYGYDNNKYSNGPWGYGQSNHNWGYGGNSDKWGYGNQNNEWNYGTEKSKQRLPYYDWYSDAKYGTDRYGQGSTKKVIKNDKWTLNNYDFEGHWKQNDKYGRPEYDKQKHTKYHVTKIDKYHQYDPYDKYTMIGAYDRDLDKYGYDKNGYGFDWFVH